MSFFLSNIQHKNRTIELLGKNDEYFKIWWLWDVYWEFVYVVCLGFIIYLWQPNPNNKRYALSQQVPGEDPGNGDDEPKASSDDSSAIELESDDKEEKKDDNKTKDDTVVSLDEGKNARELSSSSTSTDTGTEVSE